MWSYIPQWSFRLKKSLVPKTTHDYKFEFDNTFASTKNILSVLIKVSNLWQLKNLDNFLPTEHFRTENIPKTTHDNKFQLDSTFASTENILSVLIKVSNFL